jgi:CRP/FNR family transcriptional regulator
MASGKTTSQRLFVIINGRVKMSKINPDNGRELTFFLMSPGDVFDVICLLDEYEHDVALTPLDNIEALYAPIADVRGWIGKHPEFNRAFLPYLGKRIRALEELAADLTLHDTITRLSRLILRHVNCGEPCKKIKLINDLSHEELAHMIGSVRAVISRHMQKLNNEGIIKSKRKYLEIKEIHSLLEKAKKNIFVRPK